MVDINCEDVNPVKVGNAQSSLRHSSYLDREQYFPRKKGALYEMWYECAD